MLKALRRLGLGLVCLFALAPAARAERPRFVVLFDTSGSMVETIDRVVTHGDGSREHPGCDLDGNGRFDDSKLFQAKAALNDVVAAFGTAEFALARYHQDELGQVCPAGGCRGDASNACVDGRCAFRVPAGSPDYDECASGGRGCIRCADPANDPTHVFYFGGSCCPSGSPTSGGFGMAGDVVVPFPAPGGQNVDQLFSWMDGREDFPLGNNKELRGSGTTPIGGALNAIRDWLVNDSSPVGPSAGAINRDDRADCRPYNVILITDGLEIGSCVTNCKIDAAQAAGLLYHSCTNGGLWNAARARCERDGSPDGTREIRVRTWVVGFAVNDPQLNTIAAAGGTGVALVANDQAELTARLGDIIAQSIPTERCNCADDTCDGRIDETFTTKGTACAVGVGRCKRQGALGCRANGTGLVCTAQPAGLCPAAPLSGGAPEVERCGAAPGCEAPSAEDCADDDCDGLVDENISCACTSKPELCNGLDDDCNGRIDDLPALACGLAIGECQPGLTSCVPDGQGGARTVCTGATEATAELCDGKDNDCDGLVDQFGVGCYPPGAAGCALAGAPLTCGGAPLVRYTCSGACAPGVATCAGGSCAACTGAITPTAEIACDGIDNDCDGETDEGFALGGPCGPGAGGGGACRAGLLACEGGALRCVGGQGPADELCNGADDDCDGQVDNVPGACGSARGECRPGRFRCEGAALVCDQPQGPTPELCDGKDNDCDGTVDEEPIDPELLEARVCGSELGACRPGRFACMGGGLVCAGGVLPGREACNGSDDDCDGQPDNGINPPGACPPPGLAPGAPVVGECRPGANACVADAAGGAGWSCLGGVGPAAEVCNGRDDNCDGTADEEARCPDARVCADGECLARCGGGTPGCPPDRVCEGGLCRHVACARQACPPDQLCHPQRGCIDRCEGVTCLTGTRCASGVCTSCLLTGCPAGQLCRGPDCEPDPCASQRCDKGSYCRAGACVKSCRGVRCDEGSACVDGRCEPNRCASAACAPGAVCDPADGLCRANACAEITCLPGQVCVATEGVCAADPCRFTRCSDEEVCDVTADGRAVCVEARGGKQVVRTLKTGSGGCSCAVGAAPAEGRAGALPLLLAALFFGAARRRQTGETR